MAELNLFHYLPGQTPVHQMDSRYKVAGVALLSITVGLARRGPELILVSVFLLAAVALARLPWRLLLTELRRLLFFILFAVLIQALGPPGGAAVENAPGWGLTWAGLTAGLFFAWRMVAVIIVGLLLTGTTLLSEIRAAVHWFFSWIPLIPAGRIATMFSLILTLVPLVFDQAALIREAQLARGVESLKHPLKRLSVLAGPLLRQTFRRADALILAMEARCYSENRIKPASFSGAPLDRWLFGAVAGLLLLVWLI